VRGKRLLDRFVTSLPEGAGRNCGSLVLYLFARNYRASQLGSIGIAVGRECNELLVVALAKP